MIITTSTLYIISCSKSVKIPSLPPPVSYKHHSRNLLAALILSILPVVEPLY